MECWKTDLLCEMKYWIRFHSRYRERTRCPVRPLRCHCGHRMLITDLLTHKTYTEMNGRKQSHSCACYSSKRINIHSEAYSNIGYIMINEP